MNSIQDTAIFQDLGLSRNLEVAADRNELGQDDFLTLMTAQMKNQDPMKPLENGEFLGQLAQFGTVTGLEELKAEIQKLAGSLTSDQSLQAAGMLGREVLVPGATGVLTEEGEISGAVELPNSVANLKISIYDQAGQLVRNMDLGVQPAGLANFSWDGLATDGETALPGRYQVRAEAINGGANEEFGVLMAAQVKSVTLPGGAGGLALELAGLGQVEFSAIRQIRQI